MQNTSAMTRKDYAWRRMDSDKNLMIINCILLFEGKPDFARLASTIAERIIAYPRFTQKIVTKLGRPYWENDPEFTIRSHLSLSPSDRAISEQELQTIVTQAANTPLDSTRPLWNMTVYDSVGDGYAILFRLHHCMTDGLGLVHVLNHLTDSSLHGDTRGHHTSQPPHAIHGCNASKSIVQGFIHQVKFLAHITRLSLLPGDLKTSLKQPLGGRKKLLLLPALQLEDLLLIAKNLQASLNDVWLTAVTGALRQYLVEQGERANRKALRAAVTFNLRDKADAWRLGNEFTLVALELPTNENSPTVRLKEVSRRMSAIKNSYEPKATISFLSLVGHLPKALQRFAINLFTSKASVIATNLAGPDTERYLAGSRMNGFHCWVPQSGQLGTGFSFMSYAREVRIGLYVDDKLVDNPQRLLYLTLHAFQELGRRAGVDVSDARYEQRPLVAMG